MKHLDRVTKDDLTGVVLIGNVQKYYIKGIGFSPERNGVTIVSSTGEGFSLASVEAAEEAGWKVLEVSFLTVKESQSMVKAHVAAAVQSALEVERLRTQPQEEALRKILEYPGLGKHIGDGLWRRGIAALYQIPEEPAV